MPLLGPTVEQKAGSYVSEMLNYRVARRVATQLSESLAYMHSVGIGHGDCATRNIVFKLQDIDSLSEAEIYTIFGRPKCQFFTGICGCDLCSRMGNYIVQPIDMARIDDKYISNDIVLIDYGFSFHLSKPPMWKWGMDRNFAPEIAFEGRFSKASDVWALGCIIYELFTGEPLFKNDDEKDRFLAQMVPILGVFPYQWWRWDMSNECLGPKDFCAAVSNDSRDTPKSPRLGSGSDKVSLFGLDPSPHLQLSRRGAAALTELLGSPKGYDRPILRLRDGNFGDGMFFVLVHRKLTMSDYVAGIVAKKTGGGGFSVDSVIIASLNIQICYQHRILTVYQFFILLLSKSSTDALDVNPQATVPHLQPTIQLTHSQGDLYPL
ncbi:MAG: hypothetical protein Q9204_006744 [Flavoplaca sp. TL-2023a]